MAYHKTEKVLAKLAAKRELFIDAAIALVDREGIETVTMDRVAADARVSVGGIYLHFADKIELRAAVTARVLTGDCEAMDAAAEAAPRDPLAKLHAALIALYKRFRQRQLRSAMFADPAYREGLQRALRPLLRECVDDEAAHVRALSAAILGALAALHESGYGSPLIAAEFALRGIGTPTRKLPEVMPAAGQRRG